MIKTANQRTANLIKKNILETDKNSEIILYGSKARGDDKEDSDWDIIVLTDYPVNFKIERKFSDHLFDLELELEELFSIFVYSKKEWTTKHKITPFYHNVTIEGILL